MSAGTALTSDGALPAATSTSLGKSWMPTRKWWAATVLGVAGLVTLWIQKGHWSAEISIAFVALVSQRVVAYLVPNDDAPGGVPSRK